MEGQPVLSHIVPFYVLFFAYSESQSQGIVVKVSRNDLGVSYFQYFRELLCLLIGVVEEIDLERQKISVCVSMFGRETPVELEFYQVEALD